MLIEDLINNLNTKSLFKIVAFCILSFPTFQNFGQLQSILLAITTPNHTCQHQTLFSNVSISQDQCSIKINGSFQKCSKWNFSSEPVGTTMMSDYGLVCDKKNYRDMFLLIWYSTSFSAILMGWLSDKYGRKKIVIFNLLLETFSSIILAFAPNVIFNMILRFFIGVSASGVYISYIWLMESVDNQCRKNIGSFFWMFGCIAYMIFPGVVYATKNWRYTQLVTITPNIFYLLILLIPESPRWLFVMGKRNEGFESLKKIAKINKVKIDFSKNEVIYLEEDKGEILRALKSRVFTSRIFLTIFLQISIGLLYYGVSVNIAILSKNILLSIFLLGLMETPALFLSFLILNYFKRKHSLLIFGLIGSTLFWATIFFKLEIYWQSIGRIILGSIAKTLVTSVNQISMVYIAELFPTSHRSFAFGIVQLSGIFSFVGAIYINKLSKFYFFLPMTIYLVLMIISSILTFCLLPETKDLPVPETLEDQNVMSVGNEDVYWNFMKNKDNKRHSNDSVDDNNITERIALLDKDK